MLIHAMAVATAAGRVAQEATLLTQQADELLRELGVNTRSPTTGRRALLTIATNEARFAQALRLAAQVVSGGTSCPATGYCASGTLSMDGRTCCPATCARCGSIECAASPGGAGECCTAHVTATCTTEFATTCAVPIENHHVQGWDLVFFDYTAERAPLDNALVEWSALWARFADQATATRRAHAATNKLIAFNAQLAVQQRAREAQI